MKNVLQKLTPNAHLANFIDSGFDEWHQITLPINFLSLLNIFFSKSSIFVPNQLKQQIQKIESRYFFCLN